VNLQLGNLDFTNNQNLAATPSSTRTPSLIALLIMLRLNLDSPARGTFGQKPLSWVTGPTVYGDTLASGRTGQGNCLIPQAIEMISKRIFF
jgi:hypothetical protein